MTRSKKSKGGSQKPVFFGPQTKKQAQRQGKKAKTKRNRAARSKRGGPLNNAGGMGFPDGSTTSQADGRLIERDELVAVIAGSVNFATTKFAVNPGLPQSFPGLSKDAQLYSEWKLVKSRWYVKPLVSAFNAQGQTGETILSFDPNVTNPAPNSQQQAEFMQHAQKAPYMEFSLDLPPGQINRSDAKYVRTAGVPAGSDPKTYDGGNLYISTYGQGGTATCCELRHHSVFRVFKPTLLNPPTNVGELQSAGGTIAAATPFGAAPTQSGAFQLSGAGTNVLSLTGLTIGDELIVTGQITGTVITTFTWITPVGLTVISAQPYIQTAATAAAALARYTVTASTATLTLSVAATTVTQVSVIVADAGASQINLF
jgi:hypothetical protein